MIWDQLRRIVTEDSPVGRSSVKIDGPAAKVLAVEDAGHASVNRGKDTALLVADPIHAGDL